MAWIKVFKVKAERLKLKVFAGVLGCFLLCAFSFQHASAQTFAEWFSQKKTQLKYLTQQIAALEQYSSYVKQGDKIAQGGWSGIGGWVKGEFNLHSAYYSSLRTVSPAIKANSKADSIVTYVGLIPRQFAGLTGLDLLEVSARDYISQVKVSVLTETDKNLAELQVVLTDGKLEMSDDERMGRLDAIYAKVKAQLVFTGTFCSSVRLLVVQRRSTINDLNTLRGIYGSY